MNWISMATVPFCHISEPVLQNSNSATPALMEIRPCPCDLTPAETGGCSLWTNNENIIFKKAH